MKRQDLLDQFWANEIPIAPVRHAHEALEDEQVDQQRHVGRGRRPGARRRCGRPASRSACTARPTPSVQGPQPAVGQHTDEVLGVAGRRRRAARARRARRSDR